MMSPWSRSLVWVIFTLPITICAANRVDRSVPDCPSNTSIITCLAPVWKFRPDPYYIEYDGEDGVAELVELSGQLKLSKLRWEGLPTVYDALYSDCTSSYPSISASLDFGAKFLKLSGRYDGDLRALLSFVSPAWLVSLAGEGELLFYVDSPSMLFTLTGVHHNETDGMSFDTADLQLDLQDLHFHATGLAICGDEIPWDSLELKGLFDAVWPLAKPYVDQALLEWVQDLLFGCKLEELIVGDNDCLQASNLNVVGGGSVQQLLSRVIGLGAGRLFANQSAATASVLQILEESCGPLPTTTTTEITTTISTPSTTAESGSGIRTRAAALLSIASSAIVIVIAVCMHRQLIQ